MKIWYDTAISEVDQARVINAYFEAVKTRPWVTGLEGFGYWSFDLPRSPDTSVRAKLAEEIWERWNMFIYK